MKKREKPTDNTREMFYDEADDESYKRYKRIQYRNLILKALLSLVVGMLLSALIKLI